MTHEPVAFSTSVDEGAMTPRRPANPTHCSLRGCRGTPVTPRESPGVRTETVRSVANRSSTPRLQHAKNQRPDSPAAEIANPGIDSGTVVADFVGHAIGEEDGGPSTIPRSLKLETAGAMDTKIIVADAEAVLFSVKSFAAAIIAYYISLRIGFAQPVWAVTTAYLVSQPLAGAVISKALFRLLGTFLGAAAAVVVLPAFVNEPLVLSFVLALWLGLCVYIGSLDRTPRSYVFLLAGYSASIIGFPSVLAPGNIFNTAVLRVQEIGIGIVTASLVHGTIFPRSVTNRLQRQVTATVERAEQCSGRSLAGSRDTVLDRERRR